jgi:hypothetical protein
MSSNRSQGALSIWYRFSPGYRCGQDSGGGRICKPIGTVAGVIKVAKAPRPEGYVAHRRALTDRTFQGQRTMLILAPAAARALGHHSKRLVLQLHLPARHLGRRS